jgi:hypothetical protein
VDGVDGEDGEQKGHTSDIFQYRLHLFVMLVHSKRDFLQVVLEKVHYEIHL